MKNKSNQTEIDFFEKIVQRILFRKQNYSRKKTP